MDVLFVFLVIRYGWMEGGRWVEGDGGVGGDDYAYCFFLFFSFFLF